MSRKRKQRYWVETQAQDGSWNPVARHKQLGFVNRSKPDLRHDADQEMLFMREVIKRAEEQHVGILAACVMQVDPQGNVSQYAALQKAEGNHG